MPGLELAESFWIDRPHRAKDGIVAVFINSLMLKHSVM